LALFLTAALFIFAVDGHHFWVGQPHVRPVRNTKALGARAAATATAIRRLAMAARATALGRPAATRRRPSIGGSNVSALDELLRRSRAASVAVAAG
jgi:hypothetical protein